VGPTINFVQGDNITCKKTLFFLKLLSALHSNFVTSHHWIFFFLTFSPKTEQKTRSGKRRRTRERRGETQCQDEVTTLFRGRNYQISKGICRSKTDRYDLEKHHLPINFLTLP
jgi:hypothetical protein